MKRREFLGVIAAAPVAMRGFGEPGFQGGEVGSDAFHIVGGDVGRPRDRQRFVATGVEIPA